MKRLGILALVMLGMVAGWALRDVSEQVANTPGKAAPGANKSAVVALPPAAVLSVKPHVAATPGPVASRVSPTFREHIEMRNYAAEFAHLAELKARTAEEQWIYARTLQYCGRVVDPEVKRATGTSVVMPNEDEARDRFIKTLAADDPQRDKRIKAYDAFPRHRCDGVDATPIQRKAWRELMQVAADAGEAKARIDLIDDDINAQYRARMNNDARPIEVSPSQVEAMKQAVASGDPYAIERGVQLLSGQYGNFSLRDGQGQSIELEALRTAGELMACDAGYPCGESSGSMAFQCAFAGHCGASNFRDHTMYYSASPYLSQLIAQYQQSLQVAATSGDWSGFRFEPGPPTFRGTIR